MAPEVVDLDLDVLQPKPKTFRFRGETYDLPREVPISTINEAVRLEQEIADAEKAGDDEALVRPMNELYGIVMDLIRDCQPGVPDLRFTLSDLLFVLGLVTSGEAGITLNEAVIAALQTAGAKIGQDGKAEQLPPTPTQPAMAGSVKSKPASRSRKRSRASSSV